MQNIGRNDACPCGSGKKYKKCCLPNQQPTSDDLAWQRIHNMHHKLVSKLMEFTAKTYRATGYNEAWDEFNLWNNDEPFDPESPLHPMFGPWMFYHWSPDPAETELSEEIPMEMIPAEAFLEEFGNKLDALEIEDLEESLRRPFSFYDVLECKPGEWVKVQDLLTEEHFTVIEKMGSRSMRAGDLLFGKVVTVRNVSMFDGLAPIAFPPQHKITVIEERNDYKNDEGQITAEGLREFDLELLELFWELYEAVTNPPAPILTNTDGHLMIPHKMTFSIDSIEDTFEALHGLDFNESKEEILENADYDKEGLLKSVEFPWLMRGNKQNLHWDNTVLGHIRLQSSKMIVDVNSKERSKKFLTVLKKRMPKGWTLKTTVIEDFKAKVREQGKQSRNLGDDHETKELNERPEVKEYLAKMNEGHWKVWPMTPLPALKGKTPVEAVKTKDGRAMVDALLTQFERSAERTPMPGQTVETFQKLRERLGL
ncbi:MAG: SEC-C metal-binding domain-containing protein [Pseudobdellovibrionaceae bacterium]